MGYRVVANMKQWYMRPFVASFSSDNTKILVEGDQNLVVPGAWVPYLGWYVGLNSGGYQGRDAGVRGRLCQFREDLGREFAPWANSEGSSLYQVYRVAVVVA